MGAQLAQGSRHQDQRHRRRRHHHRHRAGARPSSPKACKNVAAGANPMLLKRGIEQGRRGHRRRAQASMATPVTDRERDRPGRRHLRRRRGDRRADRRGDGARSARTASSPSKSRRASSFETEYVEGMQFDRGYISPYFVTNPERMEAVLDEPYILITDKKICRRSPTSCRCSRRCSRSARTSSSSPRTSTARRWPPWSSTSCAAPSTSWPSRRRASATAARRCSRTSPS